MPFNKLHVPDNLSAEVCRKINEELHAALVTTCGVNPDDHFCLIARYGADDMILHPTFLGARDPKATIIVEIALLDGRSEAQKENLYREFHRRLGEIGFDPKNSIIFLIENSPIDWCFGPGGSVKKVLGL